MRLAHGLSGYRALSSSHRAYILSVSFLSRKHATDSQKIASGVMVFSVAAATSSSFMASEERVQAMRHRALPILSTDRNSEGGKNPCELWCILPFRSAKPTLGVHIMWFVLKSCQLSFFSMLALCSTK